LTIKWLEGKIIKVMNRTYELVLILDPEVKEAEQEKLLTKIKKQITDSEGKIVETKQWGRKELAYPLAKKRAGVFYILNFGLSAERVSPLKQKIQLEDTVLRFLLVVKETPSAKATGDRGR